MFTPSSTNCYNSLVVPETCRASFSLPVAVIGLSRRKQNRTDFSELNNMRSLSNSVATLVGMLVLWAIPAHGQIVSYRDSDGKRVFINSSPAVYVARPIKTVVPKGFTLVGNVSRTTQSSYVTPSEMSAAEQNNRKKIEEMIREVSSSVSRGPGAGSGRDPDRIELEFERRFPKGRARVDATRSGNRTAIGRE